MDYEFIDESEVEGVKRGRKTTVPNELVELLKSAPKGKAIVLREYAGDTADEVAYKRHKAKNTAMFRNAGKMAGLKVSTTWSPAGIPQVKLEAIASGKTRK